jgi:AraC-like DNA-binding protein
MSDNEVKVWRRADLYDVEFLAGSYPQHAYPWHAREHVCFGVLTRGTFNLNTRTRRGVATRGSIILINAEEVFRGQSKLPHAGRKIHIHPDVIRRTAEELGTYAPLPAIVFRGPVFEDAELALSLLELHRSSEIDSSPLESQSRMIAVISQLLARHAETRLGAPKTAREPFAVQRARELLNVNLSGKVTLEELSEFAGLPPFRLLRAFQRATGLTPHAYQVQARIRAARVMLRRREPLADVAAAVGFADQAHMSRVFKQIMGATPGQYRTDGA